MKIRTTTAAALALVALLIGLAVAVPLSAESIRLPGVGSGQLTDADLSSGRWVIVFWASWSPRGRDVPGRVAQLAQRWGGQARVVAVNFQEDPAEVERFVREQPFGAPVYLDRDGALARRYRITQLPGLLVLVDGESRFAGAIPADADAAIEAALR